MEDFCCDDDWLFGRRSFSDTVLVRQRVTVHTTGRFTRCALNPWMQMSDARRSDGANVCDAFRDITC
jgi:hypothetical protein